MTTNITGWLQTLTTRSNKIEWDGGDVKGSGAVDDPRSLHQDGYKEGWREGLPFCTLHLGNRNILGFEPKREIWKYPVIIRAPLLVPITLQDRQTLSPPPTGLTTASELLLGLLCFLNARPFRCPWLSGGISFLPPSLPASLPPALPKIFEHLLSPVPGIY